MLRQQKVNLMHPISLFCNYRFLTIFCLLLSYSVSAAPLTAPNPTGGAACVVAKKQGNSQAIEWAVGESSVANAIDKAKQALRKQGYEDVFPQANSPLVHGWMVIIKTEYRTFTDRMRLSYGCGFSGKSQQDAELLAKRDLRSFSWGWKESLGYEMVEQQQY